MLQKRLKPRSWRFSFHHFRRTFGSAPVIGCIDFTQWEVFAWYKQINMTVRYSHLAPEHTAQAVASWPVAQTARERTVRKLKLHSIKWNTQPDPV
jgi:hypothetical protein